MKRPRAGGEPVETSDGPWRRTRERLKRVGGGRWGTVQPNPPTRRGPRRRRGEREVRKNKRRRPTPPTTTTTKSRSTLWVLRPPTRHRDQVVRVPIFGAREGASEGPCGLLEKVDVGGKRTVKT